MAAEHDPVGILVLRFAGRVGTEVEEFMDKQRSILITGSSSGIGYDSAITLSQRGWRVFATCRKDLDCERLVAEGLESFPLDYSDSESIRLAFEETMSRTGGTLDALFNNGAFMQVGAVEDVPTDALRELFEVNFFGYHELTRMVIPIMRRQGYGRIVQNSSILGFVAIPWRGAYNSAKFALEGLTDTMRMELDGSGIHVSLVEPGPIKTSIRENSRSHFKKWIDWNDSHHVDFYHARLIPRLFDDSVPKDRFELPASAVTRKVIHALESRNPKRRYAVTIPTHAMGLFKRILPTSMIDRMLMNY